MNLQMWTVYDNPRDYPGCYVARLFEVDASGVAQTSSVVISKDLEVLRHFLQFEMNLTCLTRSPEDDAKVVETWL